MCTPAYPLPNQTDRTELQLQLRSVEEAESHRRQVAMNLYSQNLHGIVNFVDSRVVSYLTYIRNFKNILLTLQPIRVTQLMTLSKKSCRCTPRLQPLDRARCIGVKKLNASSPLTGRLSELLCDVARLQH